HPRELHGPDVARVAAPQVEAVPQEHRSEHLYDRAYPARPERVAEPPPLRLADVGVVAEAPAHPPLGQLPAWSQGAPVEQGAAQPGAEGEDELEPGAGDDSGAMYLGVVEHQCGHSEGGAERATGVKARPGDDELRLGLATRTAACDVVGRSHDDTVPNHARHADGGPFGFGEAVGQRG